MVPQLSDARQIERSLPSVAGTPGAAGGGMRLLDYDEHGLTERDFSDLRECGELRDRPTVTWVNVDGLQDRARIEQLGQAMRLHPLTVEAILDTTQRPKAEEYGEYLYLVAKMLEIDREQGRVVVDQLSLILGKRFVVSVQEHPGDPFDPVRNRIRSGAGRIRKAGPDYLAYALLDVIVDSYFLVIDWIGERIERLDEQISGDERPETLRALHQLKRELIFLRRAIGPLREVIASLRHAESGRIGEGTAPYLRDLYDHLVRASERIDMHRDLLAGVQEMYLARASNRTAMVMKVIAVSSSVFLPLNFITGVFGMNFDFLPLLHSDWGVLAAFASMLAVTGGMLWYFRKKRWV